MSDFRRFCMAFYICWVLLVWVSAIFGHGETPDFFSKALGASLAIACGVVAFWGRKQA